MLAVGTVWILRAVVPRVSVPLHPQLWYAAAPSVRPFTLILYAVGLPAQIGVLRYNCVCRYLLFGIIIVSFMEAIIWWVRCRRFISIFVRPTNTMWTHTFTSILAINDDGHLFPGLLCTWTWMLAASQCAVRCTRLPSLVRWHTSQWRPSSVLTSA